MSDVLTRAAAPPDRVLRYGDHPDQIIDVRYGPAGREAPVVILLHGGFWRVEYDRVHTRPMADALAAGGYTVCTPEFRRIGQPGGGYPGTFDDVAAAVDLLLEAPPTAGGCLLLGNSAGGHLALWSALRHRLPATSPWHRTLKLQGVVVLAAISDLTTAADLNLDDGAATTLLEGRMERLAETDPARLLPYGPGRLTLLHGMNDAHVPVQMSRNFTIRASSAELIELPGADHFDLIDPLSQAWPTVLEAIKATAPRTSP